MARRNRRCRGCPPDAPAVVKPAQVVTKTLDPALITREGESERLWHHVLFGTATCVGMIEGYADKGLPGNPVPQIAELIRRLAVVAQHYEKHNAN
jgi:hypothetical protein